MGARVDKSNFNREKSLTSAADHLRTALQLLDSVEAPANIGAHVDLALHQLHAELVNRVSTESSRPAQHCAPLTCGPAGASPNIIHDG